MSDQKTAALEFAAEHLSSDWPERCQEIVRRARAALAEQPPYASALAELTAAWVPFSRRLEIAERAGTVVDAQFNEIVRAVVEYVVSNPDPTPAPTRPALVDAMRGLLASLNRDPTEQELRAAAHEFTVRADRLAVARTRGEDVDG